MDDVEVLASVMRKVLDQSSLLPEKNILLSTGIVYLEPQEKDVLTRALEDIRRGKERRAEWVQR